MSDTDVPAYVAKVPATSKIHNAPANTNQQTGLSQDEINVLRNKLVNSIIQVIVQAVTGIFGLGGGVNGAITQLTNWAQGIAGDFTNIFGKFTSLLVNAGKDTIETLGNAFWDAEHNIAAAIAGIFNGLMGLPAAFFGLWGQDQDDAVRSQAQALADAYKAIAALQQSADQISNGGMQYIVDCSLLPNSTNAASMFTQTYSSGTGTHGVSNGLIAQTANATGNPSGSGDTRDDVCVYNAGGTITDYQKLLIIMPQRPGKSNTGGFSPVDYYGYRDVYGRYKDASNWVRARFRANQVSIQKCVAGTLTTLDSSAHSVQPNTLYTFECGTPGGLMVFRVSTDGGAIVTVGDSGTLSGVGVGYRSGGYGGHWEGFSGSTGGSAVTPGKLSYWALVDNAIAGVLGSIFRRIRASNSTVGTSTGSNVFPSGFFDVSDVISGDYIWTNGQNAIDTVTMTGSGGTWIYTMGGQSTAALAPNVSLSALQTAIRGLSSVGPGDCTVTGTAGSNYVITYNSDLANTPMPVSSIDVTLLTGGSAVLTHTQPGQRINCLTFTRTSNYLVALQTLMPSPSAGVTLQLYKNGALIREGGVYAYAGVNGTHPGGPWQIQAAAGDYIQPYTHVVTSPPDMTGEATGAKTFMEVAMLTPS